MCVNSIWMCGPYRERAFDEASEFQGDTDSDRGNGRNLGKHEQMCANTSKCGQKDQLTWTWSWLLRTRHYSRITNRDWLLVRYSVPPVESVVLFHLHEGPPQNYAGQMGHGLVDGDAKAKRNFGIKICLFSLHKKYNWICLLMKMTINEPNGKNGWIGDRSKQPVNHYRCRNHQLWSQTCVKSFFEAMLLSQRI
jgi:hypothetical protein